VAGPGLYASTQQAQAQAVFDDPEAGKGTGHWIIPPNSITGQLVPTGAGTFGTWLAAVFGHPDYNLYRGIWQTPTFDLRSDFKDSAGYRPDAQTIDSKAVVVGDNPHLFIDAECATLATQIVNGDVNVEFWLVEFGSAMDPTRVQALSRRNVTNAFVDNIISTFGVTGEGQLGGTPWGFFTANKAMIRVSVPGTMRYWGAALLIEEVTTNNAAPAAAPVIISGSLH
jgi:hypothetical protein